MLYYWLDKIATVRTTEKSATIFEMLINLQRGFDEIERQRDTLQAVVLELNEVQLTWTPNAAMWSARQIIEHLVLSDEDVGRASEGEVTETEAQMFRVLPRSWRRALVLRAFQRDTVLPLPSPGMEPTGTVPLPVLLSRWEIMREEMRSILETLQGNERRYFHPVLGPLTAGQMLDLEQAHIAYHTRQLEFLQRDAAFPKSDH